MWRSCVAIWVLVPLLAVSPDVCAAQGMTRVNRVDGAEMVYVPSGAFLMGDGDQEDNPPHIANLSGFYIYRNLVTVEQYRKFCTDTKRAMPSAPHFDPTWGQLNRPIVNVTWEDAKAYAAWAEMDLPTEAEWEKAARGRDGRVYPWGNDFDLRKVWCSRGSLGDSGGTTAVGIYGISPYGCSDMAGNVFEWCKDYYDGGFWRRRASDQVDPENVSPGYEGYRALRGGAWIYTEPRMFRTSTRFWFNPTSAINYFGFRCALRVASDTPVVVTPARQGPPARLPSRLTPEPSSSTAPGNTPSPADLAAGSAHTLPGLHPAAPRDKAAPAHPQRLRRPRRGRGRVRTRRHASHARTRGKH
jgi:formylglycine-generating enzyme required for sulfatase activity